MCDGWVDRNWGTSSPSICPSIKSIFLQKAVASLMSKQALAQRSRPTKSASVSKALLWGRSKMILAIQLKIWSATRAIPSLGNKLHSTAKGMMRRTLKMWKQDSLFSGYLLMEELSLIWASLFFFNLGSPLGQAQDGVGSQWLQVCNSRIWDHHHEVRHGERIIFMYDLSM